MTEREFVKKISNCEAAVVERLMKLTKNREQATTATFEAMTALWEVWKKGKLKHTKNLCGLVYVIAKNNWLKTQSDTTQIQELTDTTSKTLFAETTEDINNFSKDAIRRKAMQLAFSNLGKRCQELLKRYHIQGIKLRDLVEDLGYANDAAIRAARYQCGKQLKRKFTIALNTLKK